MDPYDRLVWEIWMPRLRQELSSWSPRTSNKMVDLLGDWRPLLPEWIMQNVVDQLIVPKLQTELDQWNPTTDVVPIHKWIHPWLPLLGD
jgi:tuftelin-interacting protein 11